MGNQTCSKQCGRPAIKKGLCNNCYMRAYRRKQKNKPTFEEGYTQGIHDTVTALDDALNQWNGACWRIGGVIWIRIEGQELRVGGPKT